MLAHVITQANRSLYGCLLSEMYRQRFSVFIQDKGWKLSSQNGLERDELDDLANVVYHVVVDSNGDLIASQRFVPGDGPTLSRGPLAHFWQRPVPIGPHAWEVSRTITAPSRSYPNFAESCAAVYSGGIEWAYGRGIERVFGVGDARFVGAMVNIGWEIEPHGLAIEYPEGGRGIAVSWPITAQALATTRKTFGFGRPFVFEAPPQLEPRDLTPTEHAFFNLCAAAQTPSERQQIVALCGDADRDNVHRVSERNFASQNTRDEAA